MLEDLENEEPLYIISVAARMVGVHAQTLRYYERVGIIKPSRTQGRIRLYSKKDIEKLQKIKTLMNDLGVNLAGVEVILRLTEYISKLERELAEKDAEIRRLKDALSLEQGGEA